MSGGGRRGDAAGGGPNSMLRVTLVPFFGFRFREKFFERTGRWLVNFLASLFRKQKKTATPPPVLRGL